VSSLPPSFLIPSTFFFFGEEDPVTDFIHDRTKEHLGRSIQEGGGSKGHSSVEDSVASLDLVKWFVHNVKTKPTIVTVGVGGGVAPTSKM
jgi:hypothetical protein